MLRRFVLAMLIGAITEAVVTGVLISYLGVSQHPSILVGILVGLAAVAAVFAATRSGEARPRRGRHLRKGNTYARRQSIPKA